MKCPKCDYVGFETGDRCRHCGYDFSLSARAPEVPEMALHAPEGAAVAAVGDLWLREGGNETPEGGAGARLASAGSYPLFRALRPDDDEPLIRVPPEPRAPLSVRRAPDPPRTRAVPRVSGVAEASPVLDFAAEDARKAPVAPPVASHPPLAEGGSVGAPVSSLGRRALAAATDHTILFGVDAAVIYLTLRMASLTMSDWTMLPPMPLLAFLGMVKVAYFTAFTTMGGQTIGKMAVGIRVIGDQAPRVDPARAIRRTLAGVVSLVPLGLGLLPVLLTVDRRALHDRVARTRVVDLPQA